MENKTIKHIAIIPDGNRRWAKKQGKELKEAYKEGIENFFRIAKYIREKKNVSTLSAWVFSTENFKRSEQEKKILWELIEQYIQKALEEEKKQNKKDVRVLFIGKLNNFPKRLQNMFNEVMEKTKNNKPYTLAFLVGYGGKYEIIECIKNIIKEKDKLDPQSINAELIDKYMPTGPLPEVDIIIRSGGEKRLSGFMPWKSSYAELFFIEKLWPEIDEKDIDKIFEEFRKRERRFGK